MLKYQIYSIVGMAAIVFGNLPSIIAECSNDYFEVNGVCFLKNPKCPDKNIFFIDECHNILQGNCHTNELWIKDKCCTISCMNVCTDDNCENCCKYRVPDVVPVTNCPNQPVTPYPLDTIKPIPPTSGFPNQSPTPCATVPINPIPPSSGCSNQTQTPCPTMHINPIAPNQYCCGQIPCISNCMANCNPLGLQGCIQFICSNNCIQQPLPPLSCCGTTSSPLPTTTTLPTPTTTTYIPTVTTNVPPPESLYECPPGTILVGNSCHIIYCPRGSIMRENRCIVIECPKGTVWKENKCSVPEPMATNLTFFNTVGTNINHSQPHIILNSVNNVIVDASMALHGDSSNSNCDYEDNDCSTSTISPPSTPLKCCEVMTPRICESRNDRWHCYSRRYRRCGDFCVKPIIYLRPPRLQATPNIIIMPPLQQDCQSNRTCGQLTDGFDCSGCSMGDMERCSYYCYRYTCPSKKCGFYDQTQYCSNNAGSNGCKEEDGCYGDWCQ